MPRLELSREEFDPDLLDINISPNGDSGRKLLLGESLLGGPTAAVAKGIARHHEREAVQAAIRAESRAARPSPVSGSELIREAHATPPRYLIDGLLLEQGNTLVTARWKTGKTTFRDNLLRSLVDGNDFLGQFPVQQECRVAVIDTEIFPPMAGQWLEDQGISQTDAFYFYCLRGRVSSLDILDPACRAEWADDIHSLSADVLILDNLGSLINAMGLEENSSAIGILLMAWDELLREAGITSSAVFHHEGHSAERGRGSTRLLDWPDIIVRLSREDDTNPDSARFMTVTGTRGPVSVPEKELGFDSGTRHLSVVGGARAERARDELLPKVTAYIRSHPGASKNEVEEKAGGDNKIIRTIISRLVNDDSVCIHKRGNAHALYLAKACPDPADHDAVKSR